MKAAVCKSLDGPGALEIADIERPEVGPGEVLIRVRAVGLNHFDTLITRGKYQDKPELPFSPGGEIAGEVVAFGSGVAGFQTGQRVMAYARWNGAREYTAVPASVTVALLTGVSFEAAAGLAITYGTALHGLQDRGRLQPGETVAVLGASGGAGLAAVEIAKLMGARVIAAASSPEKLEICRAHGADHLIAYDGVDLKTALREATGGKGPDVIYDCVGGSYAEPSLRSIAWKGRYLVVGFAAGDIPKIPLNLMLLKGCDVIGVYWGEAVKRDAEGHRKNMATLLSWVANGTLKPRIHATYPLEKIVDALGVLDRREAVGKVILTI